MSWQNICLSWLLRKTTKSVVQRPTLTVNQIRSYSNKRLTFRKSKLSRGWQTRNVKDVNLRGEWVEPIFSYYPDKPGRVILYLHGGGYCFCSPFTHRSIALGLAKASCARLFSLDYRLAPEHPFPAAVEDAARAYQWLLESNTEPSQIVLAGDSSGGGLALALILYLRDLVIPLPAGALLFSPWTDLMNTGPSLDRNDKYDVMLTASAVRNFSRHYLGYEKPNHPIASPLYGVYKNLPPLFIRVSDTEVLMDDGLRVAEKARDAGVHINFKISSGLPHAWPTFFPLLPEAKLTIQEAGSFVLEIT